MKKFIWIITCLLITARLFAQECTQYYYLQKNRTIEMTRYDEKGNVLGKSISKVAEINTANGTITASVVSESFDKNGKSNGKSTVSYKCNRGVIMVGLNPDSSQPNHKGKKSDDLTVSYMEYPPGMKVGDHLKDQTTQTENHAAGLNMLITSKTTDRNVVGRENVTTTAGSWNCLKITYKTTTTVTGDKVPKIPAQVVESTEWYVPNFGIIKFKVFGMVMALTGLK
jgi:hypothetical protein